MALVETNPAAIVSVDERGFIELANRAADELFAPRGGQPLIQTRSARSYPNCITPCDGRKPHSSRASMQCPGHRGNAEIVHTVDVGFRIRKDRLRRVAAIIAEVAEETGCRRAAGFRQ